jgi:hypothetical protein
MLTGQKATGHLPDPFEVFFCLPRKGVGDNYDGGDRFRFSIRKVDGIDRRLFDRHRHGLKIRACLGTAKSDGKLQL